MTKLPFSGHFVKAEDLLEVVHMDFVGPFSVKSTGGASYFLTIVDPFSGFKQVKFLKNKCDVFEQFLEYKNYSKKLLKKDIIKLNTDGGGEFCSNTFKEFLKDA